MELYISVVLSRMHIHTLMMSRARIVLAFVSLLEGEWQQPIMALNSITDFNNALQLLHFELVDSAPSSQTYIDLNKMGSICPLGYSSK